MTILLAHGDPLRVLSHFTIQSSILLILVLTLSARRARTARNPVRPALTGAALLYVVSAALVHHLLLANTSSPYAVPGTLTGDTAPALLQSIADHTLHTAVPIAAVLDWLFLTPPGRLRLRQATGWLLYPLAYLAFSLARGEYLPPARRAATSTPSSTSPGTATRASSATPSSSACRSTPWPSSWSPWTTPARTPSATTAETDFVSGHQWAKVNDVAATSSDIGV
ncbi:hypothetical protein GCM10020295_38530 [Streptomyces cinereospinus]